MSNMIFMAFSPRNILGCFLKKKAYKGGGGGHGPQRTPLATPLCSIVFVINLLFKLKQKEYSVTSLSATSVQSVVSTEQAVRLS